YFARADAIDAETRSRTDFKVVRGLIERLGAACEDEWPIRSHAVSVSNNVVCGLGVDLHGRDHKNVERAAVEFGQTWREVLGPLLKDYADVLEAGGVQTVADDADAGRCHMPIDVEVGQHS